jgi:hypothetical protein
MSDLIQNVDLDFDNNHFAIIRQMLFDKLLKDNSTQHLAADLVIFNQKFLSSFAKLLFHFKRLEPL